MSSELRLRTDFDLSNSPQPPCGGRKSHTKPTTPLSSTKIPQSNTRITSILPRKASDSTPQINFSPSPRPLPALLWDNFPALAQARQEVHVSDSSIRRIAILCATLFCFAAALPAQNLYGTLTGNV